MGGILSWKSFADYAGHMALHRTQWVQGNGVTKFHTLLDFQEQLLQQHPTDVRAWVFGHKPQTYEEAVKMADEYVASRAAMDEPASNKGMARVAKGAETTPQWTHKPTAAVNAPKDAEFKHKRRCFACNKVGHLRPDFAPEGHVSPETEQVSSPGSASSTHLEEHDEEDYDDDDDDDAAAAIDTQIQASDHEEVPIETVLPPNRPANTTYDAIVASEGKIVEAENRRHSDLMTVLERMIALQEETVSQLAHLHRVFIEVPKQLQKINTSFEALVVQQTQANYLRMTNVSQFNINTSQAGSVHAGQFSPNSSDLHSPGPNVTGQVADIAVQVPDDILPLPSVQIQQLTPTKEATKTKQDTHETDQPSLVQCLPTCSHVSVGTSPVREQSLPKSPVGQTMEISIDLHGAPMATYGMGCKWG
ncbi:uncharacterized protein LOC142469211 [Ascaphus truei]|uniref:uncharacterized protein LOC142469211 n=1 Tax=Ascaphus truei TaxID=8439 RepID=UPI003F5AA37A